MTLNLLTHAIEREVERVLLVVRKQEIKLEFFTKLNVTEQWRLLINTIALPDMFLLVPCTSSPSISCNLQ